MLNAIFERYECGFRKRLVMHFDEWKKTCSSQVPLPESPTPSQIIPPASYACEQMVEQIDVAMESLEEKVDVSSIQVIDVIRRF